MNFVLVKVVLGLMWLAARFSRRATIPIARFMSLFMKGTDLERITRINLKTCFPELTAQELSVKVRESLTNLCLMFFEISQIKYWDYERLKQGVSTNNESVLIDAAQNPSGVLLIVPHLGNWEFMAAYLGVNYRLAALYDPPKFSSLEKVIVDTRERYSGEMFPIDVGGLRNVIKWLRSGGLLAVLPDQVPDRNAGVYAEFFGQPALTMNLVHQLVSRTHPEVILAWVRRKFEDLESGDDYGYELNFSKLDLAASGEDQIATATAVNQAIEDAVRQAPEQYQWEYKRFKRPPEWGGSIYRRQ